MGSSSKSPFMIRGQTRKLKELLNKSDNRFCADCGALDPKWANEEIFHSLAQSCIHFYRSVNLGVFICLQCSGVHRSFGTHISKVLSVALDKWSDEEICSMVEVGGNSTANSIYEALLPEGYSKPPSDSTYEERARFLRSKYVFQEFMKPSVRSSSRYSMPRNSGKDTTGIISHSKSTIGMIEFIGILNVKVIRGTNLAIRDMLSSDPYVVLTLGQQKARTTFIKSNLNPIWNQVLRLSVPKYYKSLKLEVFDHDLMSSDDEMGDAEVELQPIIAAAMAFGEPDMLADMQIGKWQRSENNSLITDSPINVINGKFKQEISLKLQNVECGEVHLELEWIPLFQ